MFNYVFNKAAENKKDTESVLEIDRKQSCNKVKRGVEKSIIDDRTIS